MASFSRLRIVGFVAGAFVIFGAFTLFHGQSVPFQVSLVDRDGRKTLVGFVPNTTFAIRVAPDGKRIAYDTEDGTVWVADLSNLAAPRRFSSVRNDRYPMWVAGGAQIAFISERGGEQALYLQRSDGTGTAERLATARAPESFSAPIQTISFITLAGHYGISTYSLTDKKAVSRIDSPVLNQHSSQLSPDGKWIAYSSTEAGDWQVFVQPFPPTGAKFRITRDGGGHAEWSPDGKELFFDHSGQVYVVSLQTEGQFSSSTPVPLPIKGFIQGDARRQYDLMPDGKQFVMMFPH